jgi:hypothetical protein
VEGDEEITCS